MDTSQMLQQVRDEIARLQRVEQALVEASGESPAPSAPATGKGKGKRISQAGTEVISIAARLRHTERRLKEDPKNSDLKKEVVTLQEKLSDAKSRKAKMKRDAWWDSRR
jgi:hypothetical protein